MKVMQTVIKGQHSGFGALIGPYRVVTGQQSGRLIFFVENFMDVYRVVYAPLEHWLLADKNTDNLPMSSVKPTDINPENEHGTLCSHEDFRRRCIEWLRKKERSDHPAVAVLATGVGEDE